MKLIYSGIGFVLTEKENISKDESEIAIHLANHESYSGRQIVFKQEIPNQKNADVEVDNIPIEFKTVCNAQNFKRAVEPDLSTGKKQSGNILLYIKQKFEMRDLYNGIETALKFDTQQKIQTIQILYTNGRLINISRNEILDGSYKYVLK